MANLKDPSRLAARVLLILAALAGPAAADDGLAVAVSAEIEAGLYAETGRLAVRLAFTPEAAVAKRLLVDVHLADPDTGVAKAGSEHDPPVPTDRWRPGETVRYTILLTVDETKEGVRPGVVVLVAIREPDLSNGFLGRYALLGKAPFGDRRYEVGRVAPAKGRATAEDLRAAAKERADRGETAEAFELLAEAMRRSPDLSGKLAATADLLALPPPPAPGPSAGEETFARALVYEERLRWLRDRAGDLLREKQHRLALRVLETVGGVVEEQRNQKVVGEPGAESRAQKDVVDLKARLLRDMPEEQVAECRRILDEAADDPAKLVNAADREAKAGRLVLARRLLTEAHLSPGIGPALKEEVGTRLTALEKRILYDLTPEEEARLPREIDHPAFHRLGIAPSSRFLFQGPENLVRDIARDSTYRLDVAYVLLSDLFGRSPCPPGERIVVFFKETYSGPATGGGRTIVVGDAKPDGPGPRVDDGLYFHELTHCVDDTAPVHDYKRGLTEGLANLGAVFVFDMFAGRAGRFAELSERSRAALRRHHVDRENAYWLVPAYDPSEGLLAEILARHAPGPDGHADWPRLGQALRLYREAAAKSPLTHRLMVHLGWALAKAMGEGVFDTLGELRFPVSRAAFAEVEELEAGQEILLRALARQQDVAMLSTLAEQQGHSFLAARARFAALAILDAGGKGDGPEAAAHRAALGVVESLRVIGPFYPSAGPGIAEVLPPEEEIDFAREYTTSGDIARWRVAERNAEHFARLDGRGVVTLRYGYPERAVSYALTHVTVPADTEALAWIGADDEAALWVGGVAVERTSGERPLVPDWERWPIRLRKGRNRILLKVANAWGGTGFSLRITDAAGCPVAGLVADADPPDPPPATPRVKWDTAFRDAFARRALGPQYEVVAGKFGVRNKILHGEDGDRAPGWRPFSVRPGFPQDRPAALFWLAAPRKAPPADFQWRVTLEKPEVPKMVLTWDGEGDELPLSGWSLILVPDGKRFTARLERYDFLHGIRGLDAPEAWPEVPDVTVTRIADKVTVAVGGVIVFRDFSAPPLARRRFGVAVWGPEPGLASMELSHPD